MNNQKYIEYEKYFESLEDGEIVLSYAQWCAAVGYTE